MQAMTLRLPDEVHEALRREAYESRRSMNAVVLEALAGRGDLRELVRKLVNELNHAHFNGHFLTGQGVGPGENAPAVRAQYIESLIADYRDGSK